MIYIDELQLYGKSGYWCHLWADSDSELHEFAQHLGLNPDWCHNSRGVSGSFVHYDLRPSKRTLALEQGAQETNFRAYVRERLKRLEA